MRRRFNESVKTESKVTKLTVFLVVKRCFPFLNKVKLKLMTRLQGYKTFFVLNSVQH